MSTLKTVTNKVKSVLEDDSTLSTYMKKVVLGLRENILAGDLPIVMLEIMRVDESYSTFPVVDQFFTINIAAFTMVYGGDVQIIGDAKNKGILDLEKDIKLALGLLAPTLDSTLIEFTFPSTQFVIGDQLTKFPIRGVYIDMLCHLRTTLSTRT